MANEFKIKKGLIVQGSGSTVLDIQGSQGQLFSVTDSLSGSLFSVNDISGLPILQVSSDDSVKLGTFNAEAIKVSGSTAIITGSLFGTASYAMFAQTPTVAGATGATGPQGATGVVGVSGATGLTGATGTVGVSGATGVIGVSGATGLTGPTGIQGATGPIGVTGATGLTGATGGVGVSGATGLTGATGVVGVSGATGLTGATGVVGVSGATGVVGVTGATGLTGATGATLAVVNNTNNYVLTATGGSSVNGESNLTFTGTLLKISGSDDAASTGVLEIETSGGTNLKIGGNNTYSWIQSHTSKPLYINQLGNNVIINSGSGNVGIGTAAPGAKLDVSGSIRINQPSAYTFANAQNIRDNGSAGLTINAINTFTANATSFVLSGGNVGIGTTTPNAKLDVNGDAIITGSLTVTGKITAEEFHTEFISSSIIFQSGSTKFGDTSDDVMSVTGSLRVNGSITGSLFGTASYAMFAQTPTVAGATGPQGATGVVGVSGATGLTGATGVIGVSGATGLTGATGVIGVSGATGLTGATGIVGVSGATGLTGATGVIGVSGATGIVGVSGATGLTGATGVVGVSGATGLTGSTGVIGVSGATGVIGVSGATGVIGVSGATGVIGVSGATGVIGVSGATGPVGVTGATGVLSLTGTTDNGVITLNGSAPNATVESNLIFDGNNLGIGTATPNTYGIGLSRIATVLAASGNGVLNLIGAGGTINFGTSTIRQAEIGSLAGSHLAFYTNPNNSSTTSLERMRIFSSGNVFIGSSPADAGYQLDVNGNTNVTGTLTATVKSFIIDHPTKEGKKLQYGVLEGPEHSVYVRGRLTNENTIVLPDHWHGLVHEDTITVNLTSIGKKQDLWVEEVNAYEIKIGSDNKINCFYIVFAERKDIDKLVTEFDK